MLKTIAIIAMGTFLGLPTCTSAERCPPQPSVTASDRNIESRDQLNIAAEHSKSKHAKKRNLVKQQPMVKPDPLDLACSVRGTGTYSRNWCKVPKPAKTADSTPTATQLREVVAKLRLPDPTPRLGPDPSVNEWNMLAVGYPIWLWTDQPTHLSATAHHDGLTFTLTATRTHTTFKLGDGTTKTCTNTTPYPTHPNHYGTPSPTCGHTYQNPSPVGHPYTLTATTNWTITWTTTEHHGTLNHTTTGTRTLDVGELQSMIVG